MGTTSGNYNMPKLLGLNNASASSDSLVFDNHNYRGAHIGVNVTAVSGTLPVLTVWIEGQDETSGEWYPLLTSVAISLTGFNRLSIYPGITPVTNQAVSNVLPATWRIRYTVTGVGAKISATFGACILK